MISLQEAVAQAEFSLGNIDAGEQAVVVAKEKGYTTANEKALLDLATAFIRTDNYQKLAETYEQLAALKSRNYRYQTSLAIVYAQLGEKEKARSAALKAQELNPQIEPQTQEFLKELD